MSLTINEQFAQYRTRIGNKVLDLSGPMTQQRSTTLQPTATLSDAERWLSVMGIDSSKIIVNEKTSLGLSALYRCIMIIANGLATPSIKTYRRNGDKREQLTDHPVSSLVSFRPNPLQSSFIYRHIMAVQKEMYGNAVALIDSDPVTNRPVSITPVIAKDYVFLDTIDSLYVQHNKTGKIYSPDQYIHYKDISIDGKIGLGKIGLMSPSIKLNMTAKQYLHNYYQNGTATNGYLKVPVALKRDQLREIGDNWDQDFGGIANAFSTPVLPLGTEYNSISKSNVESQLMEFLNYAPVEIYQMFGVPPHLASDVSKTTSFGKGIEDINIQFLQNTLQPNAEQWEQEHNYKLFRTSEHSTHYIKINYDSYLRVNYQDRTEGLTKLVNAGIYSPNHALSILDQNGFEGGDIHMVNGTMIDVTQVPNNKQTQTQSSND